MTKEEFQQTGRQMVVEARERFRRQAFAFCRTDAEREKAIRIEAAVGEVSPEEAVLAFRLWLQEQRAYTATEMDCPGCMGPCGRCDELAQEHMLRAAWEAGFRLCRSYGDNHAHFDGEQKERQWREYLLKAFGEPRQHVTPPRATGEGARD